MICTIILHSIYSERNIFYYLIDQVFRLNILYFLRLVMHFRHQWRRTHIIIFISGYTFSLTLSCHIPLFQTAAQKYKITGYSVNLQHLLCRTVNINLWHHPLTYDKRIELYMCTECLWLITQRVTTILVILKNVGA